MSSRNKACWTVSCVEIVHTHGADVCARALVCVQRCLCSIHAPLLIHTRRLQEIPHLFYFNEFHFLPLAHSPAIAFAVSFPRARRSFLLLFTFWYIVCTQHRLLFIRLLLPALNGSLRATEVLFFKYFYFEIYRESILFRSLIDVSRFILNSSIFMHILRYLNSVLNSLNRRNLCNFVSQKAIIHFFIYTNSSSWSSTTHFIRMCVLSWYFFSD